MKIAMLLISDSFAGTENSVYNILNNIKEANIECYLLINDDIEKYFKDLEGVNIIKLGRFFCRNKLMLPVSFLNLRKKLKRILKKEDFDALYVFLEWSIALNFGLSKISRNLFLSLRGEEINNYINRNMNIANFFLKNMLDNSKKIISLSGYKISCLPYKYRKKTISILNGVDLDKFKPLNNIKQKKNVILFVGRFIDIKGIQEIVNVAKQLPKYKFWFAGQGPLENLINLPNTKNLGFKKTEELVKLYNQANICIFPSYRESFGNVGIEAMACGRAVIATPLGFSEYIENGKDGIIIPAKDEKALKDAIVDLMTNEKKRKTIEKNARKKALQYSWREISKRYLRVYEENKLYKKNKLNKYSRGDK